MSMRNWWGRFAGCASQSKVGPGRIGRRSQGLPAIVAALESRLLLSSSPLPANVEAHLAELFAQQTAFTPAAPGPVADSTQPGLLALDRGGRPYVEVWTRGDVEPVAQRLAGLGADILESSAAYHVVTAAIDVDRLSEAAGLQGVLSITPVYRPLARAGSVQTQGDAVVNADDVRTAGFDGTGVRVGVLSDSALSLSASQATGDLPPGVDNYLELIGADEGRAMLEIVHDLAPGAALAHHSAWFGELSFAEGIHKLADSGAKVLVDDVYYYSEPFFQDGIVAQAVNDVTAAGAAYFSAAGNDADRAYQSAFVDGDPGSADLQDFDPGAGVDTRQQVTVPAGMTATLVFQWDDPFYTQSGVTHNFDVRVYNAGGTLVASGTTNNLATQQPLEVVQWTASGSGVYQVEITRTAGSGASQLKYVLSTNSAAGSIDEFATHSGTVTGHAAAAGAVAVGAVPFFDPATIEPYSARGDATIYFDPAGNRLATPESRQKPDVVAPDDVNTSFFGQDSAQDADSFPNFAGTSAAAPHAAAVAALLLDANPHLTRQELYAAIFGSAVDLGAAGNDDVYGAGRIDALAALSAAQSVTDVTGPTATLVSPRGTHGWTAATVDVAFSEPLANGGASNAANYRLRAAGVDGSFDTPDDVIYTVAVNYDAAAAKTSVTPLSPATTLSAGAYRLILDATGGLADPAGNPLHGSVDQSLFFTIAGKSDVATQPYEFGSPEIAVRPDGTLTTLSVANPVLGGFKWPQLMVGQFGPGGNSLGPSRSIPTNMNEAFRVEDPALAVNSTGGVLAYSELLAFGGGDQAEYEISAQRIDADGRPVGSRIPVSFVFFSNYQSPRVAMNAAGSFVVVYPVREETGGNATAHAEARRYDAAGNPQGANFTVNPQSGGYVSTVAMAGDGSTIFAWTNGANIWARRYNAAGAAVGGEFQVARAPALEDAIGTTVSDLRSPEVGIAADGSFVISWRGPAGPQFQRYSSTAQPLGSPVLVFADSTSYSSGSDPLQPKLAVAGDGRFTVAWQGPDGDGSGIFVQRFNADGTFFGSRLLVNAAAGNQTVARLAMRDTGEFAVGWTDADGSSRVRWYSWNAPDETPLFGPWVRSLSPAAPSTTAISSITITFDRPIDPSTFTTADFLKLNDPFGRPIAITNIATADNQSFTISFASQNVRGEYDVQLGTNILDLAGRPLNQDGSAINAEPWDGFDGSFTRASNGIVGVFPFQEGFEGGSLAALSPGWYSFATGFVGTTSVDGNGPHAGAYHLRFNNGIGFNSQEMVLKLDLSGQVGATDLGLDFWTWVYSIGQTNALRLFVSGNGTDWTRVVNGFGGDHNAYTHMGLDLDEALNAAQIAFDSSVYLRFVHVAIQNGGFALDDVRVRHGDVRGPTLLSSAANGAISQPLNSLTVTFNEDIDGSTFTAYDVKLVNPVGFVVPLEGDPVDSGDHRTFTINLATAQTARGDYRLEVGPDVRDLAGNQMNQNGDYSNGQIGFSTGEFSDVYRATFPRGVTTPQTVPTVQSFPSSDFSGLTAWTFGVTQFATASLSPDGRYPGSYWLRFDQTGSSNANEQDAVLVLDLTAQASANDLTLDFTTWRGGGGGEQGMNNYLRLSVSNDGLSWSVFAPFVGPGPFSYAHSAFDLDQVLTAAGITRDDHVYIRFAHLGSSPQSVLALDDVRVRQGPLNNAPTLSAVPDFSGGTEDADYSISYAALAAAADEADPNGDPLSFRIESVNSGVLKIGGAAVVPGVTTLDPGETLVWTPPLNANGLLDAFSVRAWDGDLASPLAVPVRIDLAAVVEDPVIASFGADLSYTENKAAILLTTTATVTDPDAADFNGGTLTVQLAANGTDADRLAIRNLGTANGQISVAVSDPATYTGTVSYSALVGGVLTTLPIGTFTGGIGTTSLVVSLNSNATPARTQVLVRNLTYRNVSDDPTTDPRTVSVQLADGTSGASAPVTKQILVTPVNDKSVLAGFGGTPTYVENAVPLIVAPNGTVSDVDSPNFDAGTLTVKITVNGQATDFLTIRNQGTADGQISTSINDPATNTGTVSYTALVNSVPTTNQIGTFTGGVGNTNPLVVTLNANATPAVAQSLLRNITFQSVSENPSANPRTLWAQLTDGDGGTSTAVTKTINVTAVNDKPVVASFGDDLLYTENAGPILIASSSAVSDVDSTDFDTGTLTVKLTANGQSTDFLTIRNQGTASGQISTTISDPATNTGSVFITLTINSVLTTLQIGTFTGGVGTTPLVVTLNANALPGRVQALSRMVTYSNTSDNPSANPRTVWAQLTDGDGGTSTAVTKQVAVTPVNDKPVIAEFGDNLTYVENAVPLQIASAATLTDPDSPDFDSGKLTVKFTANGQSTDRLTIRNQGTASGQISTTITNPATNAGTVSFTALVNSVATTLQIGTFTGGIGTTPLVFTLNANALPGRVQALLRMVTYQDLSDTPSGLLRTVWAQVTDGDGGTSLAVTKQLGVTPSNDAPTIGSFGSDVSYIGAAIAIAGTATVSDPDSADFDTGRLVVKFNAGGESADRLEIAAGGNIGVNIVTKEVSYAGTVIGSYTGGMGLTALTINFNANATAAKVQELLRAITYRSTSSTPSSSPRTVQAQVFDGDGGTSVAMTKQINVSTPSLRSSFAEVDAAFAAYAAGV